MDIIEERPNITLSANNNISVIILRFRHSLYACYLFELSYNKCQIECRDHRRHRGTEVNFDKERILSLNFNYSPSLMSHARSSLLIR